LSGTGELKLGNVSPTRDLTFVKDTCSAFLEIYQSDSFFGEVTNVGMNREISIESLAKKITTLMNLDCTFSAESQRVRPEKSEVERLVCDNAKLLENSTWTPKYDLELGLIETINWLKESKHFNKSGLYHV